MGCGQIETWMMDALDGALAASDRQRLMAHLETCVDCRVDWETLSVLERLLASPPIQRPAPGFPGRVDARIERFESQRRTLVGGLILLGAAAALCLLAVPSLLNGRDPIEAYGAFLGTMYDIVSYGAFLSYKLLSALWLVFDALAGSVDLPLVNLLTYVVGAVLAVVAWRRALTSQRIRAGTGPNGG